MRGELLLGLDFLRGYQRELKLMNRGKVDRSFRLTVRYVEFLMVMRSLFSMPYRQLEAFARALNRLIHKLPSADYSWIRRRILRLNPSPYGSLRSSNEPVVIAIASSGVSVHKCGGWVERAHGKKRRYIKVHFAVDVRIKEVLAMEVTTNDFHDSDALPSLVEEAFKHRVIAKAIMDGAYDSSKAYRLFRSMGIEAIIRPRGMPRLIGVLLKGAELLN